MGWGQDIPKGLKKEQIPESARIVAIGDVFDALTMDRPYKEAWSVDDALDEIKRKAGSHFDPKLTECFLEIEAEIREIKTKWDQEEDNRTSHLPKPKGLGFPQLKEK